MEAIVYALNKPMQSREEDQGLEMSTGDTHLVDNWQNM